MTITLYDFIMSTIFLCILINSIFSFSGNRTLLTPVVDAGRVPASCRHVRHTMPQIVGLLIGRRWISLDPRDLLITCNKKNIFISIVKLVWLIGRRGAS